VYVPVIVTASPVCEHVFVMLATFIDVNDLNPGTIVMSASQVLEINLLNFTGYGPY
jgi:hypothetical protein